MTFRTGFAVKQDFPLFDWDVVDAAGNPCVVNVDAPQWAYRGTGLQVDKHSLRVRLRVCADVYLVSDLTDSLRNNIVDLAKYGADRIQAIMKRQDAKLVSDAAPAWIDRKQEFWWTRNIPWQLELGEMEVGQRFRAVRVIADYLVIARTGLTRTAEWIIPTSEIKLADLEFDYSAQEVQQCEQIRSSRAQLPVMSVPQALSLLAEVTAVKPFVPNKHKAKIIVAADDGEFEAATPTQVRTSGISLRDINAFTDGGTTPKTIVLRPGAQGVGTEVHEMLHAIASEQYSRHSWFFFDEGLTEYFTRKATARNFDRTNKYAAEYEFIDRLVKIGATDDVTLARLYFTGDWAGFEKVLRRFTGPFASIRVLHTVNWANCLAMIDYLEELHRNNTAPLGRKNAFSA